MAKRIEQVYFSDWLWHFRDGFLKRWNLQEYCDSDKPALFMGIYTKKDIGIVNSHKGFKVVSFTGVDFENYKKIKTSNVVVRTGYDIIGSRKRKIEERFKSKDAVFQIKDFSMFRPNELGDKVYCYVRDPLRQDHFNINLAREVQKHIPFEIIYGMWQTKPVKVESIHDLKKNFYDKCFINLQFNPFAGWTTAMDLAHMGRRSVSNGPAGFCVNYNSIEDIVSIINQESKNIGTIRESVIGDFFTTDKEWKNIKFWL